jgi:hypothetical protein
MALSCEATTTHDKHTMHVKGFVQRTTKKLAWQRDRPTHGKDSRHGKERKKRTVKKKFTAMVHGFAVTSHFAVRHDFLHGKGSFAVRCTLCRAQNGISISFPFYFIIFNTYIYMGYLLYTKSTIQGFKIEPPC